MTIARWNPPVAPTRQEQFLLKRLDRVRKLLGFLRLYRHELFDDAFQDELASMYRTTGAGKDARPPAMLAMAVLVQGYLGMSDAEMVELTVVDLRVQMVLGCLGTEAPAFSQGTLQEFRERLIAADLDRRLLERTVELARRTQAFDSRKLQAHVETLMQIRTQDLEPDPAGGGPRIREGVAEDRRVSIADREMRHGRKSKSKRFNGFKRHVAADVDRGLILACAVTPANRPEEDAMPALTTDLDRQGLDVDHLLIDRGYINSPLVDEVFKRRGQIICKPWKSHNGHLFPKSAFMLNMRDRTITCPAGQVQRFAFGTVVEFDSDVCDRCPSRAQCTTAEIGHGRSVAIAENEPLQQRLRKQMKTSAGRAALRERTTIEHKLAHISQRQGNHARYVGVRKNTFDLRRASAIQNLETLHRSEIESRKAA